MPYIDSPLKVEYPIKSGNIVNLYSYIKLLANTYSNRLNLIIDKEVIEIKLGFSQKNQLNINVRDEKNTPLLKVPIYCYIDEKNKGSFMLSDKEGKCYFSVPPLSDRKSLHYVNYEVNMEGMIASWKLFGDLPKIQTQSVIKIIPAKIFIEIIENKLCQSTINPYVKPIIIEHFSNNFSANFNDSSIVVAIPLFATGSPISTILFRNKSLSSAISIDFREVPRSFTPCPSVVTSR